MKKQFIAFINCTYIHLGGMPTCTTEVLPETDFNFCAPEIDLSEIQRVFIAKVGAAPFDDWTQAGEWNTRMSETDTTIDAIRPFTVIGDKPIPTKQVKDISGGRKRNTRKDHVVNFTVDDVSDANHAFLQAVENGKNFRMWYETAGGKMFGGNSGILCEVSGDMALNRGNGEIAGYQYIATWAKNTTEDRCDSPIFGQTILGSEELDTMIDFTADATPNEGSCDFILVGGVNAVAKFQYDDINPTIGVPLVMTIKIATVLALTCNMTADFAGGQFKYTHTTGTVYEGIIAAGDMNF